MQVSARVTNTGPRDGEEVVQLYVSHQNPSGKAPIRALKGFKRVALKSGESKVLTFNLRPQDLALIGEDGTTEFVTGKVKISIGGGQPGTTIGTNKNTVETTIELTN